MIGALPTSPLPRREERRAPWPRSGWSSPSSTRRSMPTRAAAALRRTGATFDDAVGVFVLDDRGEPKAHKVGATSGGKGAAAGAVLGLLGPVGLGVGVVGGALLGKLHHKDLGLEDDDRERSRAPRCAAARPLSGCSRTRTSSSPWSPSSAMAAQTEAHELDEAVLREVGGQRGTLTATGSVPGRGRAPRASGPRSIVPGSLVPRRHPRGNGAPSGREAWWAGDCLLPERGGADSGVDQGGECLACECASSAVAGPWRGAGGGTRTPDTRIMIPARFGSAIGNSGPVGHAVGHNCAPGRTPFRVSAGRRSKARASR